jgi:hypothetical protein
VAQSNLFINGSFAVWQRSTDDTAVSTTRKYVADRFAITTGAGALAHVLRSTTVPTGSRSKYSLELTGAADVTTVTVDQRIEAINVPKSTVYFSAYIYNGSGAAFTPKLYISTPAASDNWTTPSVINGSGSGESLQECADSAWTKVYWTADISGYSNVANGVEFKLEIPSGSLVAGDTVNIADAVLTYGSSYIKPLVKTIKQIKSECEYYYQTIEWLYSAGYNVANAPIRDSYIFDTMRTTPTITIVGTPTLNNCESLSISPKSTNLFWVQAYVISTAHYTYLFSTDTCITLNSEL